MTTSTTKPEVKTTEAVVYTREEILALCTPKSSLLDPNKPFNWTELNIELAASSMRVALRLYPNMKQDLEMRGIDDDKHLSKHFRSALINFLGMTKNGAGTYLYNIRKSFTTGGKLYSTNSKWNDKKREAKRAEQELVTETPVVDVTPPTESIDEQNTRWAVQNTETLELIVKNLTSRTAALAHNSELKEAGIKTRVWDKTKDEQAA